MIIYSKAEGIIGVPYKDKKTDVKPVGRIDLLPGYNDIKKEIWEKARIQAKGHIDRGILIEKYAQEEAGKLKAVKEFKELEPEQKEDIVKDTFNEKTLDSWKEKEGADSVRSAINNQKDSIKNYNPKKK